MEFLLWFAFFFGGCVAVPCIVYSKLSNRAGWLLLGTALLLSAGLFLSPRCDLSGNDGGKGSPNSGGSVSLNFFGGPKILGFSLPFELPDIHHVNRLAGLLMASASLAGFVLGRKLQSENGRKASIRQGPLTE